MSRRKEKKLKKHVKKEISYSSSSEEDESDNENDNQYLEDGFVVKDDDNEEDIGDRNEYRLMDLGDNDGENNENAAYVEIISNDFPNAWESYDPGDYWTPPYGEGETGECGGDYEVDEEWVPERFENNEEEIINNFLKRHHEEIIEELTNNAEFK